MTSVNFYDKEQTDDLLDTKADKSTTYTKTEVNTLLGTKANASDVYTKTETNTLLGTKANSADVYTKAQVDAKRTITEITKNNIVSILNNMAVGDEIVLNYMTDGTTTLQHAHMVCVNAGASFVGNGTVGGASINPPRPQCWQMTNNNGVLTITYQATYGSYGSTLTLDTANITTINYSIAIKYT